MENQNSKPIEGARELINDLKSCSCLKAVVSGSSKAEIGDTPDESIGSNSFDLVIAGDDLKEGQVQTALQRMNLNSSQTIIVENSPLGVEAAGNANIPFIVTLNSTPLDISSDFGYLMHLDEHERNKRIFKDTKAASSFLKDWCCKE